MLDRDPLLLNSFHAAILYYTITINDVDNENGKRDVYSRLYLSKFECSNIKDCAIYVIQSINPTYLIDFLVSWDYIGIAVKSKTHKRRNDRLWHALRSQT